MKLLRRAPEELAPRASRLGPRERARPRRAPWARLGVRASATALATAVVASALIVGGLLLVVLVHRSLVSGLDATANTQARNVAALAGIGRLPATVATTGDESAIVQVIDHAGDVVSASGNVTGNPAVLAAPPTRRAATAVNITGLPIADSGQSFRLVAEPVDLPTGPGWVYVANSLGQVHASVTRVTTLLAVGSPLLLIVVAAATWQAVGRALRPVEQIRRSAAAIGSKGLGQRVPVPPSRDEIARLAVSMNEMLARLQDADVRQRQFVGDASHELRSPLAALQAQVDVALTRRDAGPDRVVLRQVQDQAQRMGVLIDDLLFLARADERVERHLPGEPVDLDELLLTEVGRLRALGGPGVELVSFAAARTTGSARDLARMLRNLGDNAAAHAHHAVAYSLRRDHDQAVIAVIDDGPGIPPADRDRVFDRFVRLDQARARSRTVGGTGLGLAIAHQIVQAHGGEIVATDRDDGEAGAAFIVRLPLPPAPSGNVLLESSPCALEGHLPTTPAVP